MKYLKETFYFELTGFWEKAKPEDQNFMIVRGFQKNLILIVGTLKWSFKNLFKKEKQESKLYDSSWVLCEAKHNCEALYFLKNDKNVFLNPEVNFKFYRSFFFQLKKIIPLYFELKRIKKLQYYSYIFFRIAYYKQCLNYLKVYKPSKIIFSADIKPKHRAFLFAAKELGIKTFYFQHACISEGFPPLSFNVSFLDGQDTLDKYKQSGVIDGEIELIGLQRFGDLKSVINENKNVKVIGIATNSLDRIDAIEILCQNILSNFPELKIVLRMHPLDNRNVKVSDPNLFYSRSNEVAVIDFLKEIDLLISGDSSIHIEASIMNIVCVYYYMSRLNTFDYYGFVKNRLCFYANDLEHLNQYIENQSIRKSVVDKNVLSYYDECQNREISFENILKKHQLV